MPNFLELIAKGAKEFKGALKDAKSVVEDAAKGVARTAKGDRAAMKDAQRLNLPCQSKVVRLPRLLPLQKEHIL